MNSRPHVIIVDGYSTGAFYLPLLQSRNIPAVHVRSTSGSQKNVIDDIADNVLEKWSSSYAVLMDGSGDLQSLGDELATWHPCAVLAGCESGVELADALAHLLDLPGNNPESSAIRRDKYLMHENVFKSGLRSLQSRITSDLDRVKTWVRDRSMLPVVLKPCRSAAAEGVHICRTMEEIETAFSSIKGLKTIFGEQQKKVLAQEFAAGTEVVVNTVSCRGEHRISDLWRYSKIITGEGRSVYDGAQLVNDFGQGTEAVIKYALGVLDALGIEFGPAHMEIMLTREGPVLIECGARPMGASFPQNLLKECLGHTQLELSLQAALDPDGFLSEVNRPCSLAAGFYIKCLISKRKGLLQATPAVNLLASLPSVRSGNFTSCIAKGEVQQTVDLISSPASLFLCHKDMDVIDRDYQLLTQLEDEAQNLLFELAPRDELNFDFHWFEKVPDKLWLKPESQGQPDAELIWKALELEAGRKILDCPCGDGRVSVHLAEKGALVTGVDLNAGFIATARERFARHGLEGEFEAGDMRLLNFDRQFDTVINWFNSFGYFDVETDFEVLKGMARSLRPGGLLLVEAPSRNNVIKNTQKKFDSQGQELLQQWDEMTERMYMPVAEDKNTGSAGVVAGPRLYSLTQYRLLFRLSGLDLKEAVDENLDSFSDKSRRMILIARKT